MKNNLTKTIKKTAFSVVELLVVFLIFCVIVIALPRFKKGFDALKYVRYPHGRFECWLETNSSGKVILKEYFVQESSTGKITGGDDPTETEITYNDDGTYKEFCRFNPPKNPSYIIINAVGGGGAGAMLPKPGQSALINQYKNEIPSGIASTDPAYPINHSVSNQMQQELVNDGDDGTFIKQWPFWLRSYLDLCRQSSPQDSEICTYDRSNTGILAARNVNAYLSYDSVLLGYRNGGGAGRAISMFAPSIPQNATLYIKPGLAGKVKGNGSTNAESGQNTMIEVNYDLTKGHCFTKDGNECNSDCCILVNATGGDGGQVLDQDGKAILSKLTLIKMGGKPTDFGLSSYPQVLGKQADFKSILDNISKSTKLRSRVANLNLGDGGSGANHVLDNTSNSTSTKGNITLSYKMQLNPGDSWSDLKSNIAGCFSSPVRILKSLNLSDEDSYSVNCTAEKSGSASRFNCTAIEDNNAKICDDGYKHKVAPTIQNEVNVCPAKDGIHGGVVIIW